MQIDLGQYRVVKLELGAVTILLNQGVTITVHLGFVPALKVGDHINLSTFIAPATTDTVRS